MAKDTSEDDASGTTIPDFFSGKCIFVTGATGFMGKVLLEKLLRSCPDLSKIYILVRPKKGKTPKERVASLTAAPLFDKLRRENPENLKKIVPVLGDVVQLGLGLSQEDKKMLTDQVNVVYHAAASVRFDDPLRDAIIMNTRGTREVVNLAKQMKKLDVLLHISTTYCNTDRKVIGEQMYPPHADWRDSIDIAENTDAHTLEVLTAKYLNPLPNTYTFTKSMAEHVINDLCTGQIPAIIYRPSIVISTAKEPVSGWIDNFNGPVGLLVGVGKGIVRSIYTNPNLIADYIPVDYVIKGIIVLTWKKGMEKSNEEKYKVSVYNASNNNVNNVTVEQLVKMGQRLCWEYPLNYVLWYPNAAITQCYYLHYFRLLFYHLLPAVFIDLLLRVLGKKPMLFKVQRKIYIANMALQYFMTNDWVFANDKTIDLGLQLLPADVEAFSYQKDIDPYEFFTDSLYGSRQYLLKEDISTFETAKQHSRRMFYISQFFNYFWYFVIFYVVFVKFNLLGVISNQLLGWYEYFNTID